MEHFELLTLKNRILEHSSTSDIVYQHSDKRVKSCITGQHSFKIQSLAQTPSAGHNPTRISESVIVPKIAEVHSSNKVRVGSPSQR